jgi:hypothetical protein
MDNVPAAGAQLRARREIGRDRMPKFMDFHEDLKLPQSAIDQLAQGMRDGAAETWAMGGPSGGG